MVDVDIEPGETITRSVRKHWFMLLVSLVPFVLLAWLPSLFIPFLHFIANSVGNAPNITTFTIPDNGLVCLVYGLWLIMLWSAAFNTVTRYYLNQWIITTTRIISIQQYGFFSREVSSLLLVRVQDVDTDVEGIFGTLLGYGQLEVQSAGEQEHFIMEDIADPQGLRDLIMKEIAALHADGVAVAGPGIQTQVAGTQTGV